MNKVLLALIICGCVLLGRVPAQASDSYLDKTPTWTGAISGSSARGHVTLECDHPSRGTNVRLHVTGLTPNASYTFWWEDADGQEKPLGLSRVVVQADDHGFLYYTQHLAKCPLGDKVKVTGKLEAKGHTDKAVEGYIIQQ